MNEVHHQPIMLALNHLPETVLDKIWKPIASSQLVDSSAQASQVSEEFIFGHKINLTATEKQELVLARQQQIIMDWQAAKTEIYYMLERENMQPKAIVPTPVFKKMLDTMQIVDMSIMNPENGTMLFNPLVVDEILTTKMSGCLLLNLNSNPIRADYYAEKLLKALNAKMGRETYYGGVIIPNLDFPKFVKSSSLLEYDLGFDFCFNVDAFLKHAVSLENPFREFKESLAQQSEVLRNKYLLCSQAQLSNNFSKGTNFENLSNNMIFHDMFTAQIHFPPVPEEFQNLFKKVKSRFPHWDMFTAADPNFFRVVYKNGLDLYEYAEARIKSWNNFIEEWEVKIIEVQKNRITQAAFQEELKLMLSTTNRVIRENHTLLNREDLMRAYEIEMAKEDPIFYTPITTEYKKVSYDMTIVWGQFGESPRERQALELLNEIDHTIFLGKQSN